jgi:hypothetical protein
VRDIHIPIDDIWLAVSPRVQTCGLCDFYREGHCHRHAPNVHGWPSLEPDNWCGDFTLNRTLVREMYAKPGLVDGITACKPPRILYPEEME